MGKSNQNEYEDEEDAGPEPVVKYGLCSECCSHNQLFSHIYLEIGDDDFMEFDDICPDCVSDKLVEFVTEVAGN